jgi:hypothetical protein
MCDDVVKNIIGDVGKDRKHATIKKGKVKMAIGSKQFKFLMWKHLPLTIVTPHKGHKSYKRLNV